MASILATLGSAIANAGIFVGLSSAAGGDHGAAERKRHDLAIETLQKARDEWSRERQQRLDYINRSLRGEAHARETFKNLDGAMAEYYRVTGKRLKASRKEPMLSDYYAPSEAQKYGELTVIAGGVVIAGLFIYYK